MADRNHSHGPYVGHDVVPTFYPLLFGFVPRSTFSTTHFDQLPRGRHGRGPSTVFDYLSVRRYGLFIVLLSIDLSSTLVYLCLFFFAHGVDLHHAAQTVLYT